MIYNEDFEREYPELIDEIFKHISADELYSLTLGTFRMSAQHLKKIKKMRHSDLAFYPYDVNEGIVAYPKNIEQSMLHVMMEKAVQYIEKERIRTWQLQS